MADDAPEPPRPTLVPQPHGGALNSGGVPGPRPGKYLRRDARNAAALAFGERVPKLAKIADGRIRILMGYSAPWEAAEHFFELRERMENPDADRVRTWADASVEERKLLTEVFHVMLGAGKTQKELVAEVAVKEQLAAIDTLGKYGVGTTIHPVDEDGETLRGVIALPELSMHMVQQQQAALRARMTQDTTDADFEIVEEDAATNLRSSEDVAPPPIEERVNPELVEVIRRRRQQREENGNGNGKG